MGKQQLCSSFSPHCMGARCKALLLRISKNKWGQYKHTPSWYCLHIYLVQYVFRINEKNVNPKVSKAGHKSLVLPLKCLEGFQSLVEVADSHFHYEETANRRRHQKSCTLNALQQLQKSQSKMPRFSNVEFLFANAKYHWSHWTWNTETCNKKCQKYCLAWERKKK